MGDGTTNTAYAPVQIGAGMRWQSVTAGDKFSLAITTDGILYGWGKNHDGQLGIM
ncbi:MAG TPA: hypothetical protein ENK89_05770 [Desulfobulbaceae bacterium]|nr:hypothetical protein [Desulfobulbaceae bacterium]